MHSVHRMIFIPLALISSLTMPVAGQEGAARLVTLVQLEGPSERPAMVYRRAGTGADRDIVALAPAADAMDLARALRVLAVLHDAHGATVHRDIAAGVRSERPSPQNGPASGARRQQLAAYINTLRQSQRRQIAGFGSVRTLQVSVPVR